MQKQILEQCFIEIMLLTNNPKVKTTEEMIIIKLNRKTLMLPNNNFQFIFEAL